MLQVCNSEFYRDWVVLLLEEVAVRLPLLTLERQLSFIDSKNLQKCINIKQSCNQKGKVKEVLRYNFKFQSSKVNRNTAANFQKNTFSPNGRTGSFLRTPVL